MLDSLDAAAVRRWYEWGLAALDATRDEINSLNVFPVADADTGTNLHLTLESAVEADGEGSADLAATAVSMARLSLLGARGSSGVILSQLLRGVAEVLAAERLPPRGEGLTRALERAVSLAYAAVAQPVEGTMLTVARAAAEAARGTGSDDLRVVVKAAVEAARRALDETPGQLDVLGRAGVVDAGGKGVVVLLDVLQAVVEERPLPALHHSIARPHIEAIEPEAGAAAAYEVMYLVEAPDDRIPQLRAALDGIGDSVVVSGGGGLWTVHVHTDDAAAALDVAAPVGRPQRVRISPIDGHVAAQPQADARGHGIAVLLANDSPANALRSVFADAGAQVLVVGAADRLASAETDRLVLLTDATPSAVSAADALAAGLAADGRQAAVVCAQAAVQLLAALAAHEWHRGFVADVAEMRAAIASTRFGEVSLDSPDPVAAACALVSSVAGPATEVVTVVAATDVGDRIERRLRVENPTLDVVVVRADIGDQVWLGVE